MPQAEFFRAHVSKAALKHLPHILRRHMQNLNTLSPKKTSFGRQMIREEKKEWVQGPPLAPA